MGYSLFSYGGVNPQRLGEISATWDHGDWGFRMSNDFFPGADGGDRFRTGAGQLSYKDYSIGFLMHTGDPGLDEDDRRVNYETGGKGGTFTSGTANVGGLRADISYFGYKDYRFGWNSDGIRHVIQNRIMHDGVTSLLFKKTSPWFHPINIGSKPYFDLVASNPWSVWGY